MNCFQLLKIVSEPEEMSAFASCLEDIKILKGSFHNFEFIHILRKMNSRADNLARSAKKQPFFTIHMDKEVPVWFAEFS